MERMTQTSIANLKVADSAGFEPITYADGGSAVMVWVERNGNRAYLCGTSGPLPYEDKVKARRNVKRIRPDLEPTDI
jgi:hypothetical protein